MDEYFLNIKLFLLFSTVIESFVIIRERTSEKDGHLRIKCNLVNNDLLEFSLYAEKRGEIPSIENYSYHWQTKDGQLICRWDNTPHHPEIASFPHHIHVNKEDNVQSSIAMDISKLLEILKEKIMKS